MKKQVNLSLENVDVFSKIISIKSRIHFRHASFLLQLYLFFRLFFLWKKPFGYSTDSCVFARLEVEKDF